MAWYAKLRGGVTAIICDRGVCDTKAYVTDALWQRLLQKYHLNPLELRDDRYDAVLHLVTAADGAEKVWYRASPFACCSARWPSQYHPPLSTVLHFVQQHREKGNRGRGPRH